MDTPLDRASHSGMGFRADVQYGPDTSSFSIFCFSGSSMIRAPQQNARLLPLHSGCSRDLALKTIWKGNPTSALELRAA